jgi:2-dehydropantoate 2-reductase
MDEPKLRFLMLGAGAVGLFIAAKLSRAGYVHAVSRERHAAPIRSAGFHMTGIWGEDTYRFSASETVPEGEGFDYIFITTKSRDTRQLCEQFSAYLKGNEVVSLQNGVGNEEIIAEYTDRVIGGTIITGFEWQGPATVHVSVEAGPVRLGRFPEGIDPPVQRLVAAFCRAGIRAEASPRITVDIWAKTLYNCALNPLGAIMDVPYGSLASPDTWGIIENIVQETFAILDKEGVKLAWKDADTYLAYLRSYQLPATATHHSSMLQDIKAGRKTEIDFMNGAVVVRGARYSIAVPVNATIAALIHFRETLSEKGCIR